MEAKCAIKLRFAASAGYITSTGLERICDECAFIFSLGAANCVLNSSACFASAR
jgi:hypothetical protein